MYGEDQIEELARRLAAAEMSVFGRVSLQHAYKQYVQDKPVGDFWIQLARDVASYRRQEMERSDPLGS